MKKASTLACVAILACFLAGVSSSHSAIIVSNVTRIPAHYLTVQPSVNAAAHVFTHKAKDAPSASSTPPSTEWNKTYGGTGDDGAFSVVQTSDGDLVMAGVTDSFGAGGSDFWLVKTDAVGNMEWNKTYGGTYFDLAFEVVQTGDGGYALAGCTGSFGTGGSDFWLVKTDAGGNMEWNKTYGGAGDERAISLVQAGDGGYAMAGYTSSFGAGYDDFWLVKTDAGGNMEWNKTYGGTYIDTALSVIQTGDGGYALAGETMSFGAGDGDFWLVKTDAEGNMEWNKTYGGGGQELAYSLVQTGDGGYAMAGAAQLPGYGCSDFWLVKTDVEGNMEWNKTYEGTGTCTDRARSLVQTGDGGYAMAGQTRYLGARHDYDFWLVKTDVEGNMEWNKTFGGTGDEEAASLVQTGDGGYAMAGYTSSFGAGYSDFWLVKVALLRDITVTDVSPSKDVVGQGYIVSINITVQNQGDVTETFNATVFANETVIAVVEDVTLTKGGFTILIFNWNTTDFAKGNYTIEAQVTPVPYEADPTDNTLFDGWVFVTIPGDIDGDRDVDIFDIVHIAGDYGKPPPNLNDPNCDIDGDSDVDIFDIVAACSHYRESW